MDYLLKEAIINKLFNISGLSMDKYKEFYEKSLVEIDTEFEQMKHRFKCTFSHHFKKSYLITEIGEGCRKYSDFHQNNAYKVGFNEAVYIHNSKFSEITDEIYLSIEKSFALNCD